MYAVQRALCKGWNVFIEIIKLETITIWTFLLYIKHRTFFEGRNLVILTLIQSVNLNCLWVTMFRTCNSKTDIICVTKYLCLTLCTIDLFIFKISKDIISGNAAIRNLFIHFKLTMKTRTSRLYYTSNGI